MLCPFSTPRLPRFARLLVLPTAGWLAGWGLGVPSAPALTVTLNYTHDAAAENFFGTNPAAKAALEQAALDVSELITSNPTAIATDYFVGSSGTADVYFDFDLQYKNPSTGVVRQINEPFMAEGEVIVYVGSQALAENKLAYSSISTTKNTITWNGAGTPTERQAAAGIAAADSEMVWRRSDETPVFNTLSGPVTLGGSQVNFVADLGPIASSIWFDTDTNNNGDPDTGAQLAAFWHFDHTTPPPATKFDFYSTALHEILHSMGIGTAQSYSLLYGTSSGEAFWLGSAAQALNDGSPFNIADPDGQHIREGLMSPRLSDGTLQEALMDPTIQVGQRKGLTQMDAAFLHDLGWTLATPIPEPSSLLALSLLLALRRRRPD
jgi:hypothetical protein